jgi:hypothetical protein
MSRHLVTGIFEGRSNLRALRSGHFLVGALLAVVIIPVMSAHAASEIASPQTPDAAATGEPKSPEQPKPAEPPKIEIPSADAAGPSFRAAIRAVTYLSKAWRLANGDLCRTLMKYRAGHGEEVMSARSVNYCNRARNHLAALGSPFAAGGTVPPAIIPTTVLANIASKQVLISPKDVYAQYRQGTPAASRAFWTAHEARVRAIKARIEARWHRTASR